MSSEAKRIESIDALTRWRMWSDHLVARYIQRENIQVSARRRAQLRALAFQSYHKTLVDNFGNFEAMFTDGVHAWIKLADGRVEVVAFDNIHKPKEVKTIGISKKPKKPKKPTKLQQKLLAFLKGLDEEDPT